MVPMIPTTCRAARNHIKGLVLEAFFWIRDGKSRGDHRQMECCTGVGELKNISLRMAFCTLHQMFMSVGRGISASRDRILHLSSVVYLWIWGVEWSGGVVEWPEVFSEFSDRSLEGRQRSPWPKLPSDLDAHISHFTTKRLKSRKQSVIGVVAIMFTKTLKRNEKRTAK